MRLSKVCRMTRKKARFGKFAAAPQLVIAANLPDLDFCEPPQNKAGLLTVASQ